VTIKCESNSSFVLSSFGSSSSSFSSLPASYEPAFRTAIVGSSYSFGDNSASKSFSSYPYTSFSSSSPSVIHKSSSNKSDDYIDNLSKDITDFLIKYSSDSSPLLSTLKSSSSFQPSSSLSSSSSSSSSTSSSSSFSSNNFLPASDLPSFDSLSSQHPKSTIYLSSNSNNNNKNNNYYNNNNNNKDDDDEKDVIYGYSSLKPLSPLNKPPSLISMTNPSSAIHKTNGFPVRASYTIPNLPSSKIISVYSSSSLPSPSTSFISSSPSSSSLSFSSSSSSSSSIHSSISSSPSPSTHYKPSYDYTYGTVSPSSSHSNKQNSFKPFHSEHSLTQEISSYVPLKKFEASHASRPSYSSLPLKYPSSSSTALSAHYPSDSKYPKPFSFFSSQSSAHSSSKPTELIPNYVPPYESNEAKSNYVSTKYRLSSLRFE